MYLRINIEETTNEDLATEEVKRQQKHQKMPVAEEDEASE